MVNIDKKGRPRTHTKINDVSVRTTVSKVVWVENYGEVPKGLIVHHIDLNPANNAIDNLCLMTLAGHRRYHVTIPFNWEIILEDYAVGLSFKELAIKYNCSSQTFSRKWKKEGWQVRTQAEVNKIWHENKGHKMLRGD